MANTTVHRFTILFMITPLIYFFNLGPWTFIFSYNRCERFAAFLTLSRLPFANIKCLSMFF